MFVVNTPVKGFKVGNVHTANIVRLKDGTVLKFAPKDLVVAALAAVSYDASLYMRYDDDPKKEAHENPYMVLKNAGLPDPRHYRTKLHSVRE